MHGSSNIKAINPCQTNVPNPSPAPPPPTPPQKKQTNKKKQIEEPLMFSEGREKDHRSEMD